MILHTAIAFCVIVLIPLCGCVSRGASSRSESHGPPEMEVSILSQDDPELLMQLAITIRNTTSEDWYVMLSPTNPRNKQAPFRYAAGNQTLVVFSGLVRKPDGLHEIVPSQYWCVKRLEPGHDLAYTVDIPASTVENTAYGSLFAAELERIGVEVPSTVTIRSIVIAHGFLRAKNVPQDEDARVGGATIYLPRTISPYTSVAVDNLSPSQRSLLAVQEVSQQELRLAKDGVPVLYLQEIRHSPPLRLRSPMTVGLNN